MFLYCLFLYKKNVYLVRLSRFQNLKVFILNTDKWLKSFLHHNTEIPKIKLKILLSSFIFLFCSSWCRKSIEEALHIPFHSIRDDSRVIRTQITVFSWPNIFTIYQQEVVIRAWLVLIPPWFIATVKWNTPRWNLNLTLEIRQYLQILN